MKRSMEQTYKSFRSSSKTLCDGQQAVVGFDYVLFADNNSVILLRKNEILWSDHVKNKLNAPEAQNPDARLQGS